MLTIDRKFFLIQISRWWKDISFLLACTSLSFILVHFICLRTAYEKSSFVNCIINHLCYHIKYTIFIMWVYHITCDKTSASQHICLVTVVQQWYTAVANACRHTLQCSLTIYMIVLDSLSPDSPSSNQRNIDLHALYFEHGYFSLSSDLHHIFATC